jgi:chaperone modulatory protein CbpM
MNEDDVLVGTALEGACLTVEQLATACSVDTEWLVRHIEMGLFPSTGETPSEWRFTTASVTRVRRIRELERDFDAVPELAALVADLME